jgi:hypothetical protein
LSSCGGREMGRAGETEEVEAEEEGGGGY